MLSLRLNGIKENIIQEVEWERERERATLKYMERPSAGTPESDWLAVTASSTIALATNFTAQLFLFPQLSAPVVGNFMPNVEAAPHLTPPNEAQDALVLQPRPAWLSKATTLWLWTTLNVVIWQATVAIASKSSKCAAQISPSRASKNLEMPREMKARGETSAR